MGNAKIKAIWKHEALNSHQDIYDYIWKRSLQNADNFISELIDFGDTLDRFPLKYVECRHQKFREKNYRCAVFKKNWIFLYKVSITELSIHNIIHAKSIS